ncbi:enoyl-CoA hydratase/isomerase family protein [Lutimaribacter marinistellae]|uniref:Enoyl-CoA hydratase/isomerase family protein n=1 Tax=Lutimaribacter marinistellae TaxID=1820329 RepID=A0ABV7TPY1_9RHOB
MTEKTWLERRDHSDGVTEICLQRAPVNALCPEFLMDFAQMVEDLERDSTVGAIVITSDFKVLSAGLDLKEAQTYDLEQQQAIVHGLNMGFLALFSCPKPTVCAVNGAAIAGGLFFVLASDLRVAHPSARLGLAEVRVGADFPVGPMEIARSSLDPNTLRRLMLTGHPMSAEDALRFGVVDVIDEKTRERALVEAARLAQNPPGTYAAIKRQIRNATIQDIERAAAHGANAPKGGWFNDETRAAMARMIG